jgi:cysteine desulfurase/selenocysteine lyase
MPVFMTGGDMIREVTYEKASFNDLPYKFEAGTRNIAGVAGFNKAINYISSIGFEFIEEKDKELTSYALKKLSEIKELKLYHPGEEKGLGVVSFTLKNIHPHDAEIFTGRSRNMCSRRTSLQHAVNEKTKS